MKSFILLITLFLGLNVNLKAQYIPVQLPNNNLSRAISLGYYSFGYTNNDIDYSYQAFGLNLPLFGPNSEVNIGYDESNTEEWVLYLGFKFPVYTFKSDHDIKLWLNGSFAPRMGNFGEGFSNDYQINEGGGGPLINYNPINEVNIYGGLFYNYVQTVFPDPSEDFEDITDSYSQFFLPIGVAYTFNQDKFGAAINLDFSLPLDENSENLGAVTLGIKIGLLEFN